MSELSAPLRDVLEDPYDSERIDDVHRRLRLSRRRQKLRGMRPSLVVAAVACGAVVGAVVAITIWGQIGARHEEGPVRLEGGGRLATLAVGEGESGPVDFRLDDGSTLSLDAGARLETEENTGRVVVLNLTTGRATFDIAPLRHELVRVRAGTVDVDVIGTRFVVDHRSDEVIVVVERGLVVVRGEAVSGERSLSSGQRIALNLVTRPSHQPSSEPETPDGTEPPVETSEPTKASLNGPSWHALARERSFNEAYELLGATGVARETQRAATPDRLFALADVARLSGHPRDAISPLERLIASFPNDRRAALAAFTLGRIHLDELGDPARAAGAFERSLRLGPPPSLREDARARIVEARARAGDRADARRAARDYLERYPDGRHSDRVRTLAEMDTR